MLLGESDAGRSLLIVFSDGVDTSSWLTADAVLETARRGDVVVYGVEVGERRASFPRDLSEATGGRLFAIESTKDLSADVLQNSRRVPHALSRQLFAAGRRAGRLASARGAREKSRRHRAGETRVFRIVVAP